MAREASLLPPLPDGLARIDALCRSGVVLLSSHIQGYVENLAEVALDRIANQQLKKSQMGSGFRYFLSYDLIKQIQGTKDPSKLTQQIESLFIRDAHVWDSRPNFTQPFLPEVFLGGFGNPTHEKIRAFFGRFGYRRYEQDLARRLDANYLACRNMVDQVVDQRNRIAHGDTVTTGTPSDLSEMIRLVKAYCREADGAVGDWFRNQGCVVR